MPPWLLTQILSAIITSLAGLTVGIVTQKLRASHEREDRAQEDADAMRRGMIALLRQKLIDIHERYVIRAHAAPVEIKQQADDIYRAYHALGGNGTGTHLWEEIMDVHVTRIPTVSQQESEVTS